MAKMIIRGKEVDIDIRCVNMVKFFNDVVGLDTKFSCEGHEGTFNTSFEIMFEDYVTDEQIGIFICKYFNEHNHSPFRGRFIKWARLVEGRLKTNWIYRADNKVLANVDYKIFISLEEYKDEIN